jgi:hypothetical protein
VSHLDHSRSHLIGLVPQSLNSHHNNSALLAYEIWPHTSIEVLAGILGKGIFDSKFVWRKQFIIQRRQIHCRGFKSLLKFHYEEKQHFALD